MRADTNAFTAPMSIVLIDTHTINMVTAYKSCILAEVITVLNSMLFSLGINIPNSEAAKVHRTIRMKSDGLRVWTIYCINAGIPNFFAGKGL